MCGVVAWWSPQGTVCRRRLQAAVDSLRHRGPDGQGVYVSEHATIGLGHRRLAVMAPEDAHQPVCNETGTIRAVVNGEFYDAERLRRQLREQGHRFGTRSDSELLVHLYEEHGLACFDELHGEFAFVLWDGQAKRLLAARDRFGVKPLYCSRTHDELRLASEVRALFATGQSAEWDFESLWMTTSLQYLLPGRSLFRAVHQVPPGHFMVADQHGVRLQRYWSIPHPRCSDEGEAELLVERCRERLVHSVRRRLQADVPVCFHLSGGLDSSAVAGIAAELMSSPPSVFTIGFEHDGWDESSVAAKTAADRGMAWQQVRVRAADIVGALPAAVRAAEGIAINGHLSAKYLLNQEIARQGFKVTLTGEGADEAFLGYAHLRQHLRGDSVDDAEEATSRGMMLPQGAGLDVSGARRRLGFVPVWLQAKATLGRRIQQLLNPDFLSEYRQRDPVTEMVENLVLPSGGSCQSQVLVARDSWVRSALSGYILRTLGDGTEMPHGVEGRVPFLDHELWGFLAEVPVPLMARGGLSKWILREAARPFVTAQVRTRCKHPLDAPPLLLTAGKGVTELLEDTLTSDAMRNQSVFCPDRIRRCLDAGVSWGRELRQAWDPALMVMMSVMQLQDYLREQRRAHGQEGQ